MTGFVTAVHLSAALLGRGGRWLQRGWEAVSIYLPVLLMGLLALATYWMIQRTPAISEPQDKPIARVREVDFFMRGAVIKTYDASGRLQNELAGAEIRHYSDRKALEVDQPRLLTIGSDDRITRATALKASTADDGSQVQLMGKAVVVRESVVAMGGRPLPRQELHGEVLIINTKDNWLRSPRPAVLISGQDQFSAESLSYDHRTRVVELQGRVKATLVPR